jgi:hypothetical protein
VKSEEELYGRVMAKYEEREWIEKAGFTPQGNQLWKYIPVTERE